MIAAILKLTLRCNFPLWLKIYIYKNCNSCSVFFPPGGACFQLGVVKGSLTTLKSSNFPWLINQTENERSVDSSIRFIKWKALCRISFFPCCGARFWDEFLTILTCSVNSNSPRSAVFIQNYKMMYCIAFYQDRET